MATTVESRVLNPDPVERWIELSALEILLITPFREAFSKHLNAVELDAFEIIPADGGLSLSDAWKLADEGDATENDLLRHARSELLISTLLREMTPERVTAAADFFHVLGTDKLKQLHEMRGEDAS